MPTETPAVPPAATPSLAGSPSTFSERPATPPADHFSTGRDNPVFKSIMDGVRSRSKPTGTVVEDTRKPAVPRQVTPPQETEKPPNSPETQETPEEVKTTETAETQEQPTETEELETEKAKRQSPWKLLLQYKKQAASLERQIKELQQKQSNQSTENQPQLDVKTLSTRAEQAEARLKELEEEIKFTNYQKSNEFKEKYQKPYETAWKRAAAELAEVTVADPDTGNVRQATPQDMLALLNMPLGEARAYANKLFGEFADDAMAHRKELKSLFDTQSAAIEEAKKNAGLREQQEQEQLNRFRGEISKQVGEVWSKANQEAVTDKETGQYFAKRDGDKDWNESLEKGFALADRAFRENPMDPKLTPEERSEIIRRHAAVRNRAAGWGALKHENTRLKSHIAELEKMLEEFGATEPGTATPSRPKSAASAPSDPWESVRQGFRKYAKPV